MVKHSNRTGELLEVPTACSLYEKKLPIQDILSLEKVKVRIRCTETLLFYYPSEPAGNGKHKKLVSEVRIVPVFTIKRRKASIASRTAAPSLTWEVFPYDLC
jgi:hypothetical protein